MNAPPEKRKVGRPRKKRGRPPKTTAIPRIAEVQAVPLRKKKKVTALDVILHKVTEREVEMKVCKYAKSKGFLVDKFTSPNNRGVPDRIFIAPPHILAFVEFKAPGGVPTSSQQRDHARRRAMGFPVYIVDSFEKGKAMVEALFAMSSLKNWYE